MNWVDRDIEYLFYQMSDSGKFFQFLKSELEGVDVDCGVFSGIYTIDGELGWFEEKIVQRFEKELRDKVNPNGSWVKLRLKYLYSVNPEYDGDREKIFHNGESLIGD